ncbi:diguanylate cyclase [Pseudidiomarina sp. 1APP75-27a]|uniref:tetratricopeptide repeat-containing diguanylate cyclase n=1 Tax=Pseudidiomarina terrestris TaxID=2820060 RepID=UPI002B058BC8|nr:GGDEF domain-containing protein [Pseudidiomarina sp. 1APP75-27a]MEA3588559.1 diguanylate cyclase [Pseudidiomarina sp. 1APP75-27a]
MQTTQANKALSSYLMQVVMACALVFAMAVAQAQETVAPPPMAPAVEQQLDDMLNSNLSEAEMGKQVLALLDTLPAGTPDMTQIRVKSYLAMSYGYEDDFTKAYDLLDEIEQQALKSGFPDAITEAAATRVLLKTLEGKITEAYSLINAVIVPAEKASLPRVRYFAHNLVASIYMQKNLTERALEHLIYASDAVNETDSERTPVRRIYLKLRIAEIYSQQTQYEQALLQLNEAEDTVQSNGLELTFAPEIQFQRAYIATEMENFDAAFDIYEELEDQIKDDPQWVAMQPTVLNNLGDLAIRTKRFESGIATLEEALAIAQQQNATITEQIIRFNLGFIQVHLGNHNRGLDAMKAIVEEVRGEWISSEFEGLLGEYAQALSMTGRYQEANEVLLEQRELRAEVFNTEMQKNVTELQNLYESKDKAQQIELLEQQNGLNEQMLKNERQHQLILALGIIVALLFSILALYLYRAARRSNLALKDANAKLADQSVRDPLTGLLNRRAMQQELQRQQREGSAHNDAMVLLDIDHFKRINDKHGHAAGDDVICEVARRLVAICRENDKVIRWGGEEFLIYLSNADADALPRFVRRLLQTIAEQPITTKCSGDIAITATAGFISYPFAGLDEQQMDWEATLQLIDNALYAGKVHGRNQAWGITRLNVPLDKARAALDSDLVEAIEQKVVTAITLHGPKSEGLSD